MGGTFLAVFGAVSLVVLGDTAGKVLTQGGVSPLFVAWSRFAIAAAILAPVLRVRRGEWAMMIDPRVIARAALIAGGIGCILTALRTEPMGAVFGAFFVGPAVSYALSVLFLGERSSLPRWALLALGFAGVLIVLRPGGAVGPNIAFAVMAGTLYGGYLAATRWLSPSFRSGALLMSQLVIGALLLTPTAIPAVPSLPPALWAIVAVSALASAAGNYVLVRVSRTVPASVVAPLIYTQLVSATAAGVLVFGEWPDALTLAGLALILASGLASLRLAR